MNLHSDRFVRLDCIGAFGGSMAVGVGIVGSVGCFEFPLVALHVLILLYGFLIQM